VLGVGYVLDDAWTISILCHNFM